MPHGDLPRRVASAARRHRLKLTAVAAVLSCGAAGLALAVGAGARADAPPASAGRVMRVLYVVRRAPEPPPRADVALMPTVSLDAQPAALDPALEGVQAAQAIRSYEALRVDEASAFDAATRRAYAAADDTLRLLPRWPEPKAAESPPEPAEAPSPSP